MSNLKSNSIKPQVWLCDIFVNIDSVMTSHDVIHVSDHQNSLLKPHPIDLSFLNSDLYENWIMALLYLKQLLVMPWCDLIMISVWSPNLDSNNRVVVNIIIIFKIKSINLYSLKEKKLFAITHNDVIHISDHLNSLFWFIDCHVVLALFYIKLDKYRWFCTNAFSSLLFWHPDHT